MIDFKKAEDFIPNNGLLVLILRKKNGRIFVSYAPKFSGKESDPNFKPLNLEGTPEELNDLWSLGMTEISRKERLLADDIAKRSEELDKALAKKTPSTTAKPASKAEEAKGLFGSKANKPEEAKQDPQKTEVQPEGKEESAEQIDTDLLAEAF